MMLDRDTCRRALDARDPRFDGLFFVGVASTRIYCRPVCPARRARRDTCRYFPSAAAAEQAGFRPCLRCRPELAPGTACMDAVPRLAQAAATRIAAGALNGRGITDLAADLGVSARQLRRAMQRELGVSPLELAQTHRLLLAKQLLADTGLSITRIAFASGFQSLRRFNAVFQDRYRLTPTAVRRSARQARPARRPSRSVGRDSVGITLAYRPPYAWEAMLAQLARAAVPGVELVDSAGYMRSVQVGDVTGWMRVERSRTRPHSALTARLSGTLVPVIMPVLARVRRLLDLDAQPAVIDGHLAAHGLEREVRARPGVRVPGAFDPFEAALRTLLALRYGPDQSGVLLGVLAREVAPGVPHAPPEISAIFPDARATIDAGPARLRRVGLDPVTADRVARLARLSGAGALPADGDPLVHARQLSEALDLAPREAEALALAALSWPDRPSELPGDLRSRDATWRPWRAYAAAYCWLAARDAGAAGVHRLPPSRVGATLPPSRTSEEWRDRGFRVLLDARRGA